MSAEIILFRNLHVVSGCHVDTAQVESSVGPCSQVFTVGVFVLDAGFHSGFVTLSSLNSNSENGREDW